MAKSWNVKHTQQDGGDTTFTLVTQSDTAKGALEKAEQLGVEPERVAGVRERKD